MAETPKYFDLSIVTPGGTDEEFNIRHMRAPGSEGYFGVLAGHLPFITGLKVGEIELDTDKGKRVWATSGGYVEVAGNKVIILAETAEPADKIDIERARTARDRAIERLKKQDENTDQDRTRLALIRSLNRLKIASNT